MNPRKSFKSFMFSANLDHLLVFIELRVVVAEVDPLAYSPSRASLVLAETEPGSTKQDLLELTSPRVFQTISNSHQVVATPITLSSPCPSCSTWPSARSRPQCPRQSRSQSVTRRKMHESSEIFQILDLQRQPGPLVGFGRAARRAS